MKLLLFDIVAAFGRTRHFSTADQPRSHERSHRSRKAFSSALLASLALLTGAGTATKAATYQVGQSVSDFSLVNRLRWTNDNGQVFASGAPLRLSDFVGKIVFIEFFAVW